MFDMASEVGVLTPKPKPKPLSDADLSKVGVVGTDGAGVGARLGCAERLCAMCARTRWPAANAEQRDSSAARTAAATIRAS
jgi:hypothetical protein